MNLNFEDDELERLFKSKAKNEGGEPDFEEAAWADMERRLDKRKRRITFYYLSAAALFFGVLAMSWFFIQNNYETNKPFQNISALKKKGARSDSDRKVSNNKLKIEPKNNSENYIQLLDQKGLRNTNSFARTDDRILDKEVFNEIKKANESPLIEDKAKTLTSNDVLQNNRDSVPISRVGEVIIAQNDIEDDEIRLLANSKQKTKSVSNAQIKPKNSPEIIWSLGLNAGPEFNTAGNLQNSQSTLNAGLNFSGKLNKFSLSIGANYGIKNYSASTSQYHNIRPQFMPLVTNINASCNILEVPLALSYQLSKGKKSSFDLNAGLSSYFMLKEKYVYQYTQASGFPERIININNQNQHYFKVLQLSGTYYLPLKNTMTVIGIEPYAKIPLAGVGVGDVELKSYGINLNFRYAFKKK